MTWKEKFWIVFLTDSNDTSAKSDMEQVQEVSILTDIGGMVVPMNTSDCFMHFGNIVTNWRCSCLHQQIGEVNPPTESEGIQICL